MSFPTPALASSSQDKPASGYTRKVRLSPLSVDATKINFGRLVGITIEVRSNSGGGLNHPKIAAADH